MIDTSTDAVKALMDGVTPGKAVQFHPSYCEEAKGAAFSDWDTSHHVSVIRSDDGSRYRIAEFRHASEAAFHQSARDLVPALLAERDALRAIPAAQVTVDAYEKGMQDALGLIASLGYGENEDVDEGHEQAFRAVEKHLKEWKAARIRSALTVTPHDPAKVQALVEAAETHIAALSAYLKNMGSENAGKLAERSLMAERQLIAALAARKEW